MGKLIPFRRKKRDQLTPPPASEHPCVLSEEYSEEKIQDAYLRPEGRLTSVGDLVSSMERARDIEARIALLQRCAPGSLTAEQKLDLDRYERWYSRLTEGN